MAIIKTQQELETYRRIGRIVATALAEMGRHVRPGITTAELDAIGLGVLEHHGARSAPQLVYNFPGATCISINDEAAHGIPGPRVLQAGDIVNIDVSAELGGVFGDTGASFAVEPCPQVQHQLLAATREALVRAMRVAKAGAPIQMIGRVIEGYATQMGYGVIRNLGGHGIGRTLHEEPRFIPQFYDRSEKRKLAEGMVLTIEPFLTMGAREVVEAGDGWTMKTVDGTRSAQFEHTMVITRGEPVILTLPLTPL